MLESAVYLPPAEQPAAAYPLALIAGRTIYHFHTRTKTGRIPRLRASAPEVWVEISADNTDRAAITEAQLVEITTPRGSIRARARITGIRTGVVFVPFHYGYWDTDSPDRARAANELTRSTCPRETVGSTPEIEAA